MVERALHALLPEVRTLRLDADTTRHKGSHATLFKQFRSGKADVLIGTQMIAKGLHFPQVTLVAVLNADGALQIPDFRASEMTFQLLTQVAGRSGRGSLKGEVLIQTFLPEHPIITLAQTQDYNAFFAQEMQTRKLFRYPPFTHFVKLAFKGKQMQPTYKAACILREELILQLPSQVELLPVVPSGHAKIKDEYGFQFLIKTEKMGPVLKVLKGTLENKDPKDKVRLLIDVDPLSTFF
jgi:primosomal protein N' (replication factor Y)